MPSPFGPTIPTPSHAALLFPAPRSTRGDRGKAGSSLRHCPCALTRSSLIGANRRCRRRGDVHAQSAIVVNTSCGRVHSDPFVQLPTATRHSPDQVVHGGSATAWLPHLRSDFLWASSPLHYVFDGCLAETGNHCYGLPREHACVHGRRLTQGYPNASRHFITLDQPPLLGRCSVDE